MRVLRWEIRKAFLSPSVLGLVFLFMAFNLYLVLHNSVIKEDLKKTSAFAAAYGTDITGESLDAMKDDYDSLVKQVNLAIEEKESKSYKDMNSFFTDHAFDPLENYTKEERELFNDAGLLEYYYSSSLYADEEYRKIDPVAIAEYDIQKYGLTGSAAELVRSQYGKFEERFKEVLKNGEHMNLFHSQEAFGTHLLLFKTMFKTFLLEGVILAALITGHVINFEFDRGTHLLAYSSRRGRRLWQDKFLAALTANLVLFTVMLAAGLAVYFAVFPYSQFWQVPMSGYFNKGEHWFMTVREMTFLQYLAAVIGLSFVMIIIFTLMAALISRWILNSYLVFFAFLLLFGMLFAVQKLFPTSNASYFIGLFTPVNLVLNPFVWFMHRAMHVISGFELAVSVVWLIFLAAAVMLSCKSFNRCDLT